MSRLTTVLLLAFVATAVSAQVPPRTISAPKSEVSDEFIAYLHGLVYHDLEIRVDGYTLRDRFPEFDTPRHSPFNDISLMTRSRDSRSASRNHAVITIEFVIPLQHTVEAVNILGLRPVHLVGSDRIVAVEEHINPGSREYSDLIADSGVHDLTVLRITEGFFRSILPAGSTSFSAPLSMTLT